MDFQKFYARFIGVFFLLVAVSLFFDLFQFGHRAESWHKVFHILIGVVVVLNWNNVRFYRPFCLVNGAFFSFVALFGWVFPDFGGLDAFNFVDTVLHSVVGISGLVIGWKK